MRLPVSEGRRIGVVEVVTVAVVIATARAQASDVAVRVLGWLEGRCSDSGERRAALQDDRAREDPAVRGQTQDRVRAGDAGELQTFREREVTRYIETSRPFVGRTRRKSVRVLGAVVHDARTRVGGLKGIPRAEPTVDGRNECVVVGLVAVAGVVDCAEAGKRSDELVLVDDVATRNAVDVVIRADGVDIAFRQVAGEGASVICSNGDVAPELMLHTCGVFTMAGTLRFASVPPMFAVGNPE